MNEKTKPTFALLTALFSAITGIYLVIAWRFGYDTTLGVFEKKWIGILAAVLCIATVILALLFSLCEKKGKDAESYLIGVTDKKGEFYALFSGLMMVITSIFTFISRNDMINAYKSGDARGKALGLITVFLAVFGILGGVYFIMTGVLKKKTGKAYGALCSMPVFFCIAETCFNYFIVDRAVNDPKKSFFELLPAILMLALTSEVKIRLATVSKREYSFHRGLGALCLGVSASMTADVVISYVMKLLSVLGLSIKTEFSTVYYSNLDICLIVTLLALSLYVLRVNDKLDKNDKLPAFAACLPLPENLIVR